METLGTALVALPLLLVLYAYGGYPLLLALVAGMQRFSSRTEPRGGDVGNDDWPYVTILVPAYNEASQIRSKLENVLALDYPSDRRHVLVVSDASDDGTDEIVAEFSDRGVELLRLPERAGKSAAENAAREHVRGEVVVTTDAGVRIARDGLKPLIRSFSDPSVGVAAGRDVSVGDGEGEVGPGESRYVGYEMWVRSLETELGTIVGAGGSYYGVRAALFRQEVPDDLSRDFAASLVAHQHGFRSVSIPAARCRVPSSRSLRDEFRRKVRTMARGLQTLWHYRDVANPFRHGRFAVFLLSHKLARWAVYPALPLALVGVVLLGLDHVLTYLIGGGALLGLGLGGTALAWPDQKKLPALLAGAGYLMVATMAGLSAWIEALRGQRLAVWEPTRR